MGKQDMPKGGQEKPKKKEKGPLSPEDYAKKMELARKEAGTRGERLEKLRAKTAELFPKPEQARLRAEIEASFDVPQVGDYHNEGMFMDTHLDGILTSIEAMASGSFSWPEGMPESTRRILEETAKNYREALERYTLLHDLAKKDTLRLSISEQTPEGAKSEDVAYSQAEWQALVPEEVRRDPAKLLEFMQSQDQPRKIVGISYFHQTGDKTPSGGKVPEGKKHGESGSEAIRNLGETGVDELTLTAITNHEVAYSFSAPNVDTYEKFFGGLSPEERDLVMVASFVDTMSSLRLDGSADPANFLALAVSRFNSEALKGLADNLGKNDKLEKKKVESALLALKKAGKPIDAAAELARLEKECRPTEYDPAKLDEMLGELMSKNALTAEEAADVRSLILANNQAELGKKYGKKMKDIRTAMIASEKKD
jgi:hypothetical protein